MFKEREVGVNVQEEGRVWQMFNRRDVGNKCSIGGTCVVNIQQERRGS